MHFTNELFAVKNANQNCRQYLNWNFHLWNAWLSCNKNTQNMLLRFSELLNCSHSM